MSDSSHITSSEILGAVLSGSSVRVAVLDRAGRFLLDPDPNPPIPSDIGAPPGANFLELYGDAPGLREAMAAAFAGEVTHLTRRQGGATYVGTFLPRRSQDGSIDSIFAVAIVLKTGDVLEQALSEVQARERRMFHSNMTGLLYWDETGTITDANETFFAMTGYTREDLTLGRLTLRGLVSPEHRATEAAAEPADGRGSCSPVEKEYVCKDGGRLSVLEGASSLEAAGHGGIAFVVDITDRKRQERERRETELALRRVVDAAPIVLWAVDARGTFTLSMGRGLRGMNLDPDQVLGRSAFEIYADVPEMLAAIRRCLSGKEFSQAIEIEGLSLEIAFTPLRDASGAVKGILGVSIDVSERRRAQAEREALEAQLVHAQKLESLGLLAGGIAHDFNNMLTVILGCATTAQLTLPADHPAYADLQSVIAATNRAAGLTHQMLAYSGRAQVTIRPIDLSAHVREVATLLETAVSRKVGLALDLQPDLPPIAADESQIQQVVMNLVMNASEAIGDAEGTVTVTTGLRTIDPARGSAQFEAVPPAPGEYVVLEVHDTGRGMDEATQSRIFDPFFTTKLAGRGLGLAATLGIVRAHRGAIRVDSSPGRGTTFTVLFPSARGVHVRETQPGETELRGHGSVLVIDDEGNVRAAARRMLESVGFSVIEAGEGEAGVQAFEQHASEIVLALIDLTMPGMNGREALRALRKIRPDLPVVLMSGYHDAEATRHLIDQGLAIFLEKPFTLQRLAASLARALAVH